MPLPDSALPVRMRRIAVIAPHERLRDALVALADDGGVELSGELPALAGPPVDALRRLEREPDTIRGEPRISRIAPDLEATERAGDWSTLAGESELARRAGAAIQHGPVSAVVGWVGAAGIDGLRSRLAPLGVALVELESPRWIDPPTLLRPLRGASAFRPLVDIYGAARYPDIDPTPFAAVTFVLMFGMMFGDVGHGLVLVLLALLLRRSQRPALARYRSLWPLPAAAGGAAAVFGLLYGEAFGPTGFVPTLWLAPLDDPVRLLVVAIGVGAVLLVISYGIGTLNRWREDGPVVAILAPSGVAGLLLLVAGGVALLGWYRDLAALMDAGLALGLAGDRTARSRVPARPPGAAASRLPKRSSRSSTPRCAPRATPSRSRVSRPSDSCMLRSARRSSTVRTACAAARSDGRQPSCSSRSAMPSHSPSRRS